MNAHDTEENTVPLPDLHTHPDVTALRTRLQHVIERLSPSPGQNPDTCRERALRALQTAAADVQTDPTLALRGETLRWFDLLTELVRQMSPVLRQAALAAQAERLTHDTALTEPEHRQALALLGKINPRATAEADHLAERIEQTTDQLHTAVNPHWNEPEHRARLARHRLDSQMLDKAAESVRYAVSAAEAIDPHLPEVQALRAMATTLTETATGPRPCAAPDCTEPLPAAEPGRTRRYCSPPCRTRARRAAAKR